MRNFIWIGIVATVALAVMGQSGSSLSFLTSGTCNAPQVGMTSVCGTANDTLISANGAAYVSLKGAAGPAGATGPIGPPGPAGPSATKVTCTTFTISNGSLVASGCTFQ
jgi:hypothetical protein